MASSCITIRSSEFLLHRTVTIRVPTLTPWCRVLLEKLTGLQLVKKLPAFHWTRRFITALTSVRHLSLSRANPIQSIYPHHTSWRSILILSTHLRLGLPSGLFPSGFPTKNFYTPLSSPIRATCLAHRWSIYTDIIVVTVIIIVIMLSSSLVTSLFSPVLHLNQRRSLLLRLQVSHCSTFRIMCDVPRIAVLCGEFAECFLGMVSKFFFKPFVIIPVAPIVTNIIIHFRFHIRLSILLLLNNRYYYYYHRHECYHL